MRVLVTGHLGYIGAHVTEVLRQEGHTVCGVDLNLFQASEWMPISEPHERLIEDLRNLTEPDLEGFDAVIHLAGMCNDPMGTFAPELTTQINLNGTLHLARTAKAAGVPRFLFASSCSIYGKTGDRTLNETDRVEPLTVYGTTKHEAELALSAMTDDGFSPTYLRNATAYGSSPRLRLDLLVNDLCARAFASGELRIISDGSPWRPFVHCRDIARAFAYLAQAPVEKIHDQAFNIGATAENFRVRDVASLVLEAVPGSRAVYLDQVSADARDYKVDFSKFATAFPDFEFTHTVCSGIDEMIAGFKRYGMTRDMIDGPRFSRLKTLQQHIEELQPAAGLAETAP
jgi:nucleoside-diphosphate-sugar epimerase